MTPDQIAQALKSRGKSQKDAASAIDLDYVKFNKVMRNVRRLTADEDRALRTWLESTPVLGEPGREFEHGPSSGAIIEFGGSEYARIPVFDIRFAAGAGAINYSEQPIDFYPFNVSFLRTLTSAPVHLIAGFQAFGDSMEETIYDRDWCFADLRQRSLMQPGIYAMVFEGDGLLKRASQHIETKAVTLTSDNKKYPSMTIKKPDRLSVVGRVFMSIRRH